MQLRRLALLVFTVFAPVAAAQSFEDDAETGTVTIDETPPGRWEYVVVAPGCSFTSTAAAAHRGTRGLSANDAAGGTGRGRQAQASVEITPPVTGEYHLRFWFRLANSNSAGNLYIAALEGPLQDLVSMEVVATSGQVKVGGYRKGGTSEPSIVWIGRPTATPYSINDTSWRLVELSARGIGTSNGTRELRIDGVALDVMTGIDWSTWSATDINLGEFWADPLSFQGTLHFDDVRGDTQSHATSLRVDTLPTIPANECVPMAVSLQSSEGEPRAAPYAFDAALTFEGPGDTFFEDAACQTVTTRAAFPKGALFAAVYVKAGQQGETTISASYVDFLRGSATVMITPPLVVDAGTDAGFEDDAGTDPGADAGDPDAGMLDGGVVDAGTPLDAPVAVISPDEVTVAGGVTVELDASGSMPPAGASITGYRWELVEGPTFVEAIGHEKVSVTPHEPGIYVFRLVVTDSLGRPSQPVSARLIVGGDVSPPEARLGGCGCNANGSVLPLAAFGWILVSALRRQWGRFRSDSRSHSES